MQGNHQTIIDDNRFGHMHKSANYLLTPIWLSRKKGTDRI